MSVIIQEPLTKDEIKSERAFRLGKLSLTWYQAAFGAVLVLAAILNLIMLNPNTFSNEYYAAAVRSMLTSWHNFFFASFDPGGFVTVDKPPVFLWLETISAWLFGYNGITIVLPSALAGIGSVALLHQLIKKIFGPIAALVAAFSLAITPIAVIMNRHNNPESILIFFMLLGAWAIMRAADNGKFAWLVLAMALMGIAFNVKMLEAFIVLPTYYLVYLLFAKVKWWKRFVFLGAATVVLAVVSLSWTLIVDATPTNQRPYIGSSSDNTVADLILGYNGLNRIDRSGFGGPTNGGFPGGFQQGGNNNGGFGNSQNNNGAGQSGSNNQNGGFQRGNNNQRSGSSNSNQNSNNGQQGSFPFGGGQNGGNRGGFGGFGGFGNGVIAGQSGPFRMFDQSLVGEASWLLPLALLGMLFTAVQYWFRFRKDKIQKWQHYKGLLLWSGWLLTFMVVFSIAGGTFHSYYLVLLAPGVAALVGIAVEAFWHAYQQGGWQKWLLPMVLVVNAVFEFNVLSAYANWNRTIGLTMFFLELLSAAMLLALSRFVQLKNNRWTAGIATVGFLGLSLAPLAWASSDIFNQPYTNETLPTAVPVGANLANAAGFLGTGRNATGLFNNLFSRWNSQLTLMLVALIVVIALAVVVRLFVKQLSNRTAFNRIVAGLAVVLVITLGGSMALNSMPVVNAAAKDTQPVSTGQIGNPQDMLSDATISKLISYLETNRDGATYILATTTSNNAAPIIIKTGQSVMALGGFQGNDKILTANQFAQLVKDNTVRYVLLDSGGGFGGFGGGGSQSVTSWVQQTCKVVNSQLWSTDSSTTTNNNGNSNFGRGGFGRGSQATLYNCGA